MKTICTGVLSLLVALALTSRAAAGEKSVKAPDKVRVVIIDGQNNHNWRATTPVVKKALEASGRFTVDVSTAPPGPKDKKGTPPGWQSVPFPPDLGKYDVVLSNYNGAPWPADFQKAFDEYVKAAKVGLVVFHAANNSFGGWPEFNRMIGMGWRNNKFGDRLYFDADGKEVRLPKGQGPGASETTMHPFRVTVRDGEHPVTKGMPREWLHTADQLVHGLRGPAENVHVLATAHSDKAKRGTGEHELMLWTVTYGKGRIFHTPMGHDVGSVRCVGFLTAILRGTEWAATGQVTLPVPTDFPTPDKTSSRADK